uniref:Uncharacterized protein n=1 Tax=Plectus sambesii TaxID=2011161 RepID=A0A914X6X8_9BILA
MAVEGWDFLSYKSREELVKTVAQELQCTEEMHQAYYEQFMQGHDRSTVAGAPWVDRLATKEEIADLTVAMVLDVHANFGRLLIPENIRKPELAVFFDLNTTLDGQAIGARTNDAREIVYPGLLVEIVIQTSTANVGPTGKIASGVVRCTGMTIYDEHCLYNQLMSDSRSMEQQTPAEDALREESVMVVGVRSSGLGGAITAEQEMVLLHSHVAPDDQLLSAIAAHSDSPSSNNLLLLDEWKPTQLNDCDLMAPGRVVLARVAILPSWIRKLSAGLVNVRYVASTIRSNGHTLHGIGRIVKYLEKGGLLEPIDGSADLIYFAIEFLPKTRGFDVQ